MDKKTIERISTSAGVIMLGMLAIFGILGCFEFVFDINYFSTRAAADFWTVVPLIICVLIFCCFIVSTMLNVSRIAQSVEQLAHDARKEHAESKDNQE